MTDNTRASLSVPSSEPPLNLLSLDGGGVRGVSELVMLHIIMKHVQTHKNLPNTPKPCEYFDLIGGTSTGGLIAIMLGRLKMSTMEALEKYTQISRMVFSPENRKRFYGDAMFKKSTLEDEMRKLVVLAGCSDDERLSDTSAGANSKGNTFVCCSAAGTNMGSTQRFRTYEGHGKQGPDCKIWEAACATTAAPTFFKAIKIAGSDGAWQDHAAAGRESTNPAKEVRDEAKELFGSNRRIGAFISIRTGYLDPRQSLPRRWPLPKFVKALRTIATDCEKQPQTWRRSTGKEATLVTGSFKSLLEKFGQLLED
ncbi:acyl transferase/acyl hydrolase/lysophospholipase [Armillaria mellea]|nr:acyl transferase/acyl hydrolase/lysophospholipase [Armillaria mellea]